MVSYDELLDRRRRKAGSVGRTVRDEDLHVSLKPFQRRIVKWAAQVGRAAVWADTGLGKTRMQIEWCRNIADRSLIVTPLAVAQQTVQEAELIGVDAHYVRSASEVSEPGLYVTNVEMVDRLDPSVFGAVALDEASILKASDGKTRRLLIDTFQHVSYRTTWTATPAPNDPEELTNQAEFLGQMTRNNMLAAYFIHDDKSWRLKGHAVAPMLDWMSTWAIAVRRPSDLGDSDDGYVLPGLNVIPEIVQAHVTPHEDELFAFTVGGVGERSRVRKETLHARVNRASELASQPGQWLMWCGLNDEADQLTKLIPGAVNVQGSMSPEDKATELLKFASGETRVLVTKPKIAGMGMNFQSCHQMVFVGINDSWEQYYQAIRRCYRFGQQHVVEAHVVVSQLEQAIADNVARKEQQANQITDGLIARRTEKAA